MFCKTTLSGVTFLLVALVHAVPQVTPTTTVTVSECPLGTCTKICATPTVTVDPANKCSFNLGGCPIAKCVAIPAITSTSTSYCKAPCTSLTTKDCSKLPTVTLVPPCPTKCPELCPIPIETVAVACPTTITIS